MSRRLREEVPIEFTHGYWRDALHVAVERQITNTIAGLQERHGASSEPGALQRHAIGCLGEAALCYHLSVKWASAYDRAASADVGEFFQVRAVDKADRENSGLILHPDDPPGQVYVLAEVDFTTFFVTLKGWRYGKHGQEPEFWRTKGMRRPCFIVPATRLEPMAPLPIKALA